jgi:hypothetical protein
VTTHDKNEAKPVLSDLRPTLRNKHKLLLIKQEGNQSSSSSEFQTCVLIVCFLMVINCLIDSKPTRGDTKHLQPKYFFWVLAKLSELINPKRP